MPGARIGTSLSIDKKDSVCRVETVSGNSSTAEVKNSAAEIEIKKGGKDVARLADHSAQNLIVEKSVTSAQNRLPVKPKRSEE